MKREGIIGFDLNTIDELISALSLSHKHIIYSSSDYFVKMAEHQTYHPDKSSVERSLQSLKEHFQEQIKPIFDSVGKETLLDGPVYRVLSRTYRTGDHQDYWLCTARIRVRLKETDLFVEQQLMQFNEMAQPRTEPEQIRLVDHKGDDVLDLKGYLTDCDRV